MKSVDSISPFGGDESFDEFSSIKQTQDFGNYNKDLHNILAKNSSTEIL